MFGKKKDKDLMDRLDVYDVAKVYINGIPGDMDRDSAREEAARLMHERHPDLPIIPVHEEHPKDTPYISIAVEGQRLTVQPDGSQKFEWLMIAGVFTPLKREKENG